VLLAQLQQLVLKCVLSLALLLLPLLLLADGLLVQRLLLLVGC
jgi:hypothetical protein